jgi:hypothetical protein
MRQRCRKEHTTSVASWQRDILRGQHVPVRHVIETSDSLLGLVSSALSVEGIQIAARNTIHINIDPKTSSGGEQGLAAPSSSRVKAEYGSLVTGCGRCKVRDCMTQVCFGSLPRPVLVPTPASSVR